MGDDRACLSASAGGTGAGMTFELTSEAVLGVAYREILMHHIVGAIAVCLG